MKDNSSNLAQQLDENTYASSVAEKVIDHQFLTFELAGEEYGINITRVQEIKGWLPVTRIPNTPDYVSGVLNLRGNIVPIIDMRCRFNLERVEYSPTTVIIVLSVEDAHRSRHIGIIVDAVSDVLNVNNEDIKDPPEFGEDINVEFISGLTASNDKMVMILEIDKMLMSQELKIINEAVAESDNE